MNDLPQHEMNKPVGQYADVALGLILGALGGEFTVTIEHREAHLAAARRTPQVVTQQLNDDGSITFRIGDCPHHITDDTNGLKAGNDK